MTAWLRQTRVRLALAYSGIFSVVALVATLALSVAIATIEYSAIDDSLASEARSVQAAITSGGALPGGASAGDTSSGNQSVGVGSYIFDTGGRLLDRAGQGPRADALGDIAHREAASGAPLLETSNIDGVPQRLRASRLKTAAGDARVVVITRSRAEADQLIATTATVLVLGMLVLIIAATVLGLGLAGTALRPVREIVAAARAFSEQDLHRRITLDLPADDLGELADTFNQMLGRLETAFESLRRFTADAAHELRAPLTLIRTEAEVTLSRPRTAEHYQASLATILAEARRLGRLADQLLMLARAEAGALVPQLANVDLVQLVEETVRIWQPLAAERQVSVVSRTQPGVSLWADVDLVRRLVDNLIDNALRHSPAGTEVAVAARLVGAEWEIEVVDQGPGVPESAREVIFERFSRTDQSRGRESGGAGLGLALCAAIAQLHHGSISLDDSLQGGARFVVRLPVAPPA